MPQLPGRYPGAPRYLVQSQADTREIEVLYEMKKDRLQYGFKPYIWQVGGKFVFPDDKDKRQYHYPRGFDDCFAKEINTPFLSFL